VPQLTFLAGVSARRAPVPGAERPPAGTDWDGDAERPVKEE
jgi:hypothetical protein